MRSLRLGVGCGPLSAFLVCSGILLVLFSANLGDARGQDCSNLSISLSATPANGSAPLTVRFDASLEGPWAAPIEYDWYFGDGTSKIFPNSGNPTEWHTYGSWTIPYKVFVSVKDSRGCWRQTFATVAVSQATSNETVILGLAATGAVVITAITIVLLYEREWRRRTRPAHKAETRCTSCGFANPPYAQSFCVKCGGKLEAGDKVL